MCANDANLFGEPVDNPVRTRPLADVDAWINTAAPASWEDGYRFLRARGVRYRYAMLAAWLSCGSDDRGDLGTRADFADFMGVSRSTTYQWEERQPVREWAEMLRVMRLRGARLAEVDERTYLSAAGETSSAADRKLYYQRAGVWEDQQRLTLVGDEDADAVRQEQQVTFDVDRLPVAVLEALAAEGRGLETEADADDGD